jgi:D-lactate dehydrogenase
LYLKVVPDKYGKHIVKVVNTLGIEDLDSEEGEFVAHKSWDGVIPKLDSYIDVVKNQQDNTMKNSNDTYGKHQSHDSNYKENLCTVDNNVSRFNADTKGLDCNRSEGKVLILATVHDTFESPSKSKSYWLSFEDLETTVKFKTEVCLDNPADLPMSIEYMDRDSFDVIDQAGRFMGHFIKFFGSASPIVSAGWAVKLKVEALDIRGAATFPDTFQYYLNTLLPSVLPKKIMDMAKSRDHHIATTIGDYNGSLDRFEERFAKFCKEHEGKIDVHECTTASEKNGVTAFRFIAAAAFKTYCVGTGLQGISVDYALPKNHSTSPQLPESNQPVKRMRYSHFGCNVVHEDLAYAQGVDTHASKMELKHVVDEVCKGRLPAEHGHGTEYQAPADTQKRWMKMDPFNVMNPGVGGLSTKYRYEKE